MIEEAIFSMLTGDAAIKKFIGDDGAYPGGEVPQGKKKPAVTYQRSGGLRDYDMEGATGFVESRFLIAAHAEGNGKQSAYSLAKKLLRAVEDRFHAAGRGYHQVGSTQIQSIFINSENDNRSESAAGLGACRLTLDCTFFHKEV